MALQIGSGAVLPPNQWGRHLVGGRAPFAGRQVGHVAGHKGLPDAQHPLLHRLLRALQALEHEPDGVHICHGLPGQPLPELPLHA